MNSPQVSVIIPCYNRASLVGETIENMLRQSLPPSEVIVVDDGSTDDSVKVIQSFGNRVKLIEQSNQGPGAARNRGMGASAGDFIQFMDSDDLASLNKLEVQVRALEQSGGDIAIAPWIMCRLDAARAHPKTHVLQQGRLPPNPARALVSNWTVVLQTACFRRSLLHKVGGFNPGPEFIVVEDQLLFLKCFLTGTSPVHTPECLVVYRTDGLNKLTDTGLASEKRLMNVASYLLEARRLFAEAGVDPCSWFLFRLRLWVAWRDLAAFSSPRARELSVLIAAVLGTPSNRSVYALTQKALQWLGGFRQRLFGDRSALALRAAPIRPQQISLISELGYSVSGE